MRIIALLFPALVVAFSVTAQAPVTTTSGEIYLNLRKLQVLGSVLYVAAHPDDENTRLLTYFAKDRLYRTGYLSLTRGDGGQNLVGDEQGIELGLIRTQELLAARRIDGAEQFFTRAFDFGFSKTPAETFTKWDKEKILADVVWVIRKFQPDVIITRFPVTGEGGHGHHTASAILANEAFTAAADPRRFPDQLKWVQPWAAKRILWNTFNFGSTNTTNNDQFHFDVGGFNPVLGKSYGEIAADSRSQHKSQGFGVPRGRGEAMEYFRLTGGEAMSTDLMEGVTADWKRLKGSEKVTASINQLIAGFDFLAPQKSLPGLLTVRKELLAMPQQPWRDAKLSEVNYLVEQLSGLWADAFTSEPFIAQGDSARVNIVLNNRSGVEMTLQSVRFPGYDTTMNSDLPRNKNLAWAKTVWVPATFPVTQPYWLQERMKEGYYEVADQRLIGQPDVQPALVARFTFVLEGQEITIDKPVRYKTVDPVRGELYQPFVVLPPVTFTDFQPVHFTGSKERATITITANKDVVLIPEKPVSRITYSLPLFGFASIKKGATKSAQLPADLQPRLQTYLLNTDGNHDTAGAILRTIKYEHIPHQYYFKPAVLTVKALDVQTRGKRIGYITGAGDKVPEALEQMGYEVTLLGEKELARNNLKNFDAIISGVRAYNTAAWLNNYHQKLMDYVAGGGNLIVQYNTSNQIGPVRAKIGPYPFNISRNRITDENAAVQFLLPQHPVLNFPNKITQDDFNGWIQERSIYHAANYDSSFAAVLSMADPGEKPDAGSLVIAKHGRGYFTYTGLVFFRELPAGVPGAYRLMANLIALNQKKEL